MLDLDPKKRISLKDAMNKIRSIQIQNFNYDNPKIYIEFIK